MDEGDVHFLANLSVASIRDHCFDCVIAGGRGAGIPSPGVGCAAEGSFQFIIQINLHVCHAALICPGVCHYIHRLAAMDNQVIAGVGDFDARIGWIGCHQSPVGIHPATAQFSCIARIMGIQFIGSVAQNVFQLAGRDINIVTTGIGKHQGCHSGNVRASHRGTFEESIAAVFLTA